MDPVHLFCCYIQKLNRLFEKRRDEYGSLLETDLPRSVAEMIKHSLDDGSGLFVIVHNRNHFEVERKNDSLKKRVVDLSVPSCSCGFYKEFGILCRYICAAVLSKHENPKDLIIPERPLVALKMMYNGHIVPVDMNVLDEYQLKAPTKTKKRGGLKENRMVSKAENE